MKNTNKSMIKIPFVLLNASKKDKYKIGSNNMCVNDTTIYVYAMLAGIKPDNKGLITVKQETLANKCGISTREIIKQIGLLKHLNLLQTFATYQDNGYKGYNKYKLSIPQDNFTFIDRTLLEHKNLSYNAKILYVRLKKGINSNEENGKAFRFNNKYTLLIDKILNKAYDKRTLERLLNELSNEYINYNPSYGICEIILTYETAGKVENKIKNKFNIEYINWEGDFDGKNNIFEEYETFEDWCDESRKIC